MATYVNNLRLKEIATGDEAGTWGTSTNDNLELIADGLGFATEAITTNADTHTSEVRDATEDAARSMYIKYTGTLDSACTITINQNAIKRVHFIENATSGSQNIIIKQGSGSTVTIGPGNVKVVYLDGAGSGAAVNDVFASLAVVDLKVDDDLTVTDDASVGGDLLVSGEVQTANIGFTDGDNAITIADGGGITAAAGITSTAASNTFGATSFNDANITNVGDIALDSLSADGSSISIASPVVINGTTPSLTIGDAGEEDTSLVFDGNAKDFYMGLDDSADKLVLGVGSTVGTNSILTLDDDSVVIGDGAAVDTSIVFDGNAQDFYIALDDSADDLLIGHGSTVGSNVAIGINESQVVQFNGAYTFPTSDGSANQVLQTNGSGALSFGTVSSTPTAIQDADGDTKVQCEESSDEDIIRFDTGGSERLNIDSSGNITHAGGRTKLGGTLADTGILAVLTGSSGGVNGAAGTQSNGSVIFANTDGSSVSPAIMLKGDGSQCAFRTATANGANHDIEFNIREEDDSDFASTGGSGFMFSRYGTDLLQITRNGNVDIGFSGGVGTGDGNPALRVTQSSTSFNGNLLQLQAKRSSSSAFSLIQAYANFASDPKFKVRGDGEVTADGSFSGGGADYAEFFEWNDGNSSNEDRVGYSVSLVDSKIKIAESGETIIGVVSGNPSVVGDAQELYWQGKYEKDDYGRDVYEDYTQTEWVESKDNGTDTPEDIRHSYQTDKIPSGISAPSDATVVSKDEDGNNLRRRKRSSSYDESLTYIPRSERKEWACVGLMGKVRIKKGQQTGASWIKLKDVSSDVEEWLIK
jgi:hypothetical protein